MTPAEIGLLGLGATVLIAVLGAGFRVLWARISAVDEHNDEKRKEIWDAFDKHNSEDHAYHIEAERRFVAAPVLTELRQDFRRLEEKLDKVLGHYPGGHD